MNLEVGPINHRLPFATIETQSYQNPFNLKHLFSVIFLANGYQWYLQQPLVINYVTYRRMTCSFLWLAMLQFVTKLQKCIRMGITIFKIFILGGISSDIWLEITFYVSARASRSLLVCRCTTKFPTVYQTIYLPKIKF